jgi:hypothetical protein
MRATRAATRPAWSPNAHGRAHAGGRRDRSHGRLLAAASRCRGADAHDIRPGRVRLRGDTRRSKRLHAQGPLPAPTRGGRAHGRHGRRAARARDNPPPARAVHPAAPARVVRCTRPPRAAHNPRDHVLRFVAAASETPRSPANSSSARRPSRPTWERIVAKLEVRDRTLAVVAAYETGLVEPGSP